MKIQNKKRLKKLRDNHICVYYTVGLYDLPQA